jgi:uncharacterized membrane protein
MLSNKSDLLSFKYYFFPVNAIILSGLTTMSYLAISHYRVYTDIGYESFCAISRSINCDTVSQSPYSIFLGIPVPIWGMGAYLFTLYLLLLAGSKYANKQRMWPLLFWISLCFSIYSLILAGISSFIIHSYCLMCILGYFVNFALLYYAWFINRRFGDKNLIYGVADDIRLIWAKRKSSIPVIAVLGIFFLTGPFWFPQYWQIKPPKPAHTLPNGITEKGHPWIGAENPSLIVEEFTDYMCFQCRKMHYHLRRMIEAHPDKIRLVHRHFPMDHQYNPLVKEPYHIGAGKLSLIAIQAKKNGVFWKASDYCYTAGAKREKIELADITSALSLNRETIAQAFSDQDCLKALFHDIKAGLKLGISATPSYLINGKVHEGQIPPDLIKNVIK